MEDFQQIQKDISKKNFWKPRVCSPKMPKKWGGLPKWDRSHDLTGRVNIIHSLFFPGILDIGNRFSLSKNFLEDISLCLLNIFATAAPK